MRFLPIAIIFFLCRPVFSQDTTQRPPTPAEMEEEFRRGLAELKADVLPEFPGGQVNLEIWLAGNLNVPYIRLREDTVVTVYVDFVVDQDGKVTDARIRYPGFRQLDKEVLDMFYRMPKWKPGILNGKYVPLNLTIPMKVALGNSMRKPYDVPAPELTLLPQYKGGGKALAYFIRKNMQYPPEARSAGVGGAIVVEFLVMSNGRVDNAATVGDAIGYGLEEEAVRIVEKMPKWIPAQLDGKPVTSKHQLVIRFDAPAPKEGNGAKE